MTAKLTCKPITIGRRLTNLVCGRCALESGEAGQEWRLGMGEGEESITPLPETEELPS